MYENPLGSDACAGSTPARGTKQKQREPAIWSALIVYL